MAQSTPAKTATQAQPHAQRLEQWALDCLDNVASLNADAMIEDKKAKAEARAEKLAAEKEAIAQAAEDMKKKTGKAA